MCDRQALRGWYVNRKNTLDVTRTIRLIVDSGMTECTYCGSDVDRHEPVFVAEQERNGERVSVGQFCNYACLHAYIEDEELVYGASCKLDWE